MPIMSVNLCWRDKPVSKKERPERRLDIRLKKGTNSLFDHLKQNKDHQIDWGRTVILDKERDYFKRIVKESLYINAFKDENLMNLEDGTSIDPLWSQFNSAMRKCTRL